MRFDEQRNTRGGNYIEGKDAMKGQMKKKTKGSSP
jgi:hypothetical protein